MWAAGVGGSNNVALMAEHVGIFICGFGFGERGNEMENDAESGRGGWETSCALSLRGRLSSHVIASLMLV
jgi:hypothetical protein